MHTLLNIYRILPSFFHVHLVTLLALNTLEEALVCRLLLVVLIPKKRSTLTIEDTRDPRILVRNSPYGDTDASLDGQARFGNALKSIGLNLQLLRSSRGVHAEIELGVDNVNAKVSSGVKSSFESLLVWGGAWGSWCGLAGKMGLVANTVDADTVGLDKLNDARSTLGLLRVVLEVVVVVEELGLATVLVGEAESNREVGLANGV